MEQRTDDELVVGVDATWGGGPLSFDELQAMVRAGVESSRMYSEEDVESEIDSLLS